MRKFGSGEDLAKEIGVKPEVLKKTCESGVEFGGSLLILVSRGPQSIC